MSQPKEGITKMPGRMNRLLQACFLLLIVLVAFVPSPVKCNQQDKDYIIGPGDVLEIKVWDHDDLFRRVEVSQEGAITYPFIGRIKAANHSVFELETLLQTKLADGYLVAPQVNVTVAEYINQKIFLFGEVNKPGSYTLKKKIHLLELISEAGGFTPNRGSTCIIVRPSSVKAKLGPTTPEQVGKNEIIEVNLDDLIAGRTKLSNAYVKPGDSVYVKEAENVYVIGEVDKPGKFKWVPGLTVLQAISLAGGGTSRAAINRVTITRRQNGKEKEYRPELGESVLPNDIIKVPESYF
jgi:polysaccharide export outer membrane protein